MNKTALLRSIITVAASLLFWSAEAETIHLDGADSPYSVRLSSYFGEKKEASVKIEERPAIVCISTARDPLYIGLEQSFIINAPADKVTALLDDFSNYPNLFEDIVKAYTIKKESSCFILRQEQKMPIPFLPHLVYDMSYFTSVQNGGKRYVYKLCGGKDMKYNDGMISISPRDSQSCRFYELDFIYGNWSALGKLSESMIWEGVVKGAVAANLTIKVKAEHPGWSFEAAKKEAKRINGTINYAQILKDKRRSELFFTKTK